MATALKTGTNLPPAYTSYPPWIDKVNGTASTTANDRQTDFNFDPPVKGLAVIVISIAILNPVLDIGE